MRDTIFARSSGSGRAGVAVYRISGPLAGPVLDDMAAGRGEPRRARLVRLSLADGSLLDEGLILWFPAPNSFTGEDVAELHLHGSPAVERALTNALVERGLVPAAAGAFTLRAFEAGRLDLSEAEGLADLLEAETEAQRRQALGQLGGGLSARAGRWRSLALQALASIEAVVDFPDEDDVPDTLGASILPAIDALRRDMEGALAGAGAARALRRGVTVVLTGPPNAGKSSLLNRLLGEPRAIVSDRPGTTRDVIEVSVALAGTLVTLIDTAGLREVEDEVEAEGIARARRAISTADVRIELRDASDLTAQAEESNDVIWVANKIDRVSTVPQGWIGVSALTGDGVDALLTVLGKRFELGDASVLTRQRHVDLVHDATVRLSRLSFDTPPELVAEDLRRVVYRLDELVGRIAPDDVLGEIFASFCIGK